MLTLIVGWGDWGRKEAWRQSGLPNLILGHLSSSEDRCSPLVKSLRLSVGKMMNLSSCQKDILKMSNSRQVIFSSPRLLPKHPISTIHFPVWLEPRPSDKPQ